MTIKNPIENVNLFSKKKTFFTDSSAERISYEHLSKILSDDYIIIPHVSLSDLFTYSAENNADYDIHKFLGYHVDFAIFDITYHAIMAIELNGIPHKYYRAAKWNDIKKREFFEHFKVPLITIDISSLSADEIISSLEHAIKTASFFTCCWKCNTLIECSAEDSIVSQCPTCGKKNIPVKALFRHDDTAILDWISLYEQLPEEDKKECIGFIKGYIAKGISEKNTKPFAN